MEQKDGRSLLDFFLLIFSLSDFHKNNNTQLTGKVSACCRFIHKHTDPQISLFGKTASHDKKFQKLLLHALFFVFVKGIVYMRNSISDEENSLLFSKFVFKQNH